jgi:hypothetical protein
MPESFRFQEFFGAATKKVGFVHAVGMARSIASVACQDENADFRGEAFLSIDLVR